MHLQLMEVPRLGAETELQLPAYTTATAMPDLSSVCDLQLYGDAKDCQQELEETTTNFLLHISG